MKSELKAYEERMRKSVASVAADFAAVRAGRANAAVLDRIMVDYYGTPTPIHQIASIGSPDPRTLTIQPWDAGAVKLICKAIQESDLGINPQNDGKVIRLAFPQLTEERRKDLVKQIAKYAEGGKVAVRNIRRDAVEDFKAQKKASEITEDDMKIAEKEIQKLTDDMCKEIDELLAKKERELMLPVKERADFVIDTTRLSTAKLRQELLHIFSGEGEQAGMTVSVTSFGFKYGLPLEADLVLDVRFMPNPFYMEGLRHQTGLDKPVSDYVFSFQQTQDFLRKVEDLLRFTLPLYAEEGKTGLVIAIGCTGGHHRSVAIAHALAEFVREQGYQTMEHHRDMDRAI